jgi:hypothetical protein
MVELSAGARQGDSGGPILNQRGELAGVLFGTAAGQTTGSYCGRVRSFLASVDADFRRLPSAPTMVAQQSPRVTPPTAPQPSVASPAEPGFQRAPTESPVMRPPVASIPGGYAPLAGPPQAAPPPGSAPDAPAEPSAFDQVKSFLAAVGLFAIFMHGLRLLVPGQRRPVSRRS